MLPVFIQSWIFPNHLMAFKLRDIPAKIRYLSSRIATAEVYIGSMNEMYPHDDNRVTLAEHSTDRFGNPLARLSVRLHEIDNKTLDRTRELIRSIFDRLGAKGVREAELTWSRHHIGRPIRVPGGEVILKIWLDPINGG